MTTPKWRSDDDDISSPDEMSSRGHFVADKECLWKLSEPERATLHIVAAFDAEFFEFGVQSRALEAESLGRTVAAANLTLGFAKHAQDVIALCGMKGGVRHLEFFLFLRNLSFEFSQRNI